MDHVSVLGIQANLVIQAFDPVFGEVFRKETHNRIPTAGLGMMMDLLFGNPSYQVNYFALGTGTNPPAPEDTQLQAEFMRDFVTQRIRISPTQIVFKFYLPSLVGNGNTITEAALVAGGSLTPDTGVCLARATFPGELKTSSLAWTFTWTLTLQNLGG